MHPFPDAFGDGVFYGEKEREIYLDLCATASIICLRLDGAPIIPLTHPIAKFTIDGRQDRIPLQEKGPLLR